MHVLPAEKKSMQWSCMRNLKSSSWRVVLPSVWLSWVAFEASYHKCLAVELIHPPLDSMDAAITIWCHSCEKLIRKVDCCVSASHALVLDRSIECATRANNGDILFAVWVVVGSRAHKTNWKGNSKFTV